MKWSFLFALPAIWRNKQTNPTSTQLSLSTPDSYKAGDFPGMQMIPAQATPPSELHLIAETENTKKLVELIHSGAFVDEIDSDFSTPLHSACRHGQ